MKQPARKKSQQISLFNLKNEMLKAEDFSEFSFKGKNVTQVNTLCNNQERSRERNEQACFSPRWNFLFTDIFEERHYDEGEGSSESLMSLSEPQNSDEDCF